eukprot:4770594-Pleurochrysis_carterae.AAC.2
MLCCRGAADGALDILQRDDTKALHAGAFCDVSTCARRHNSQQTGPSGGMRMHKHACTHTQVHAQARARIRAHMRAYADTHSRSGVLALAKA